MTVNCAKKQVTGRRRRRDPAAARRGNDEVMDHDAPTIRPRRIQNQNVIHRLERRRISSGKAGTHWHQVRVFHQNVFPNFTVVNVEKPPCFLRKFSPDGRYFIAFSSDQTSLEIYEYQGCQAAEDLLQGYEGEILANGNDQRSVNIRGRLFERFFVKKQCCFLYSLSKPTWSWGGWSSPAEHMVKKRQRLYVRRGAALNGGGKSKCHHMETGCAEEKRV